jgi:hypothetical protein
VQRSQGQRRVAGAGRVHARHHRQQVVGPRGAATGSAVVAVGGCDVLP